MGDYTKPVIRAHIKDLVDSALKTNHISGDDLAQLSKAAYISSSRGIAINAVLLQALVLYIGQSAMTAAGPKISQAFTGDSPQASLLMQIARELHPEPRYYFISAMVHQLRYPNTHTHYFSNALLHLFGTNHADQQQTDIREQITRVLFERLHAIKPHPWGLVVTMLELIKNKDYNFFQLPFIATVPAVRALIVETLHGLELTQNSDPSYLRRPSGNLGSTRARPVG